MISCSRCGPPARPGSRLRGARTAGAVSPRCSAGASTGTARPASSARRSARAAGTRGKSRSVTGRAGRAAASALTGTAATLAGGQPITAATPAGAYRTAIATVAAHQALRIAGAAIAAAAGAEPARISATTLRDAVTASIGAGQGATTPALAAAIEIIRRDITAHPLRFVTTWRPGRHYPASPSKRRGPARATTSCPPPPGCTCCRCPRRQDRSSRTPRRPPDQGMPSRPGKRRAGTPACAQPPRPRPARPVPGADPRHHMPISLNVTNLPPQKPAQHRKSNHATSPDPRTPRGTLARTDSQPTPVEPR